MALLDLGLSRHVGTHHSLRQRLRNAIALYRQRRDLYTLDAAALHDIGITRAEARAEASRSVWDVPANWRC